MLFNSERATQKMEEYDLDALIATSPANVVYSSDVRGYATILPRDKNMMPVLIVPQESFQQLAVQSSWINDIRSFGPFVVGTPDGGLLPVGTVNKADLTERDSNLVNLWNNCPYFNHPLDVLIDAIKDKQLGNARIGLDESAIDFVQMDKLRENFPHAEFIAARKVFFEIRMVKTKEELGRLRRVAQVNEEAATAAIMTAGEGVTPREITQRYREVITAKEATVAWFDWYAGWSYVSDPNRKMKKGDPWFFDCGCSLNNYFGDTGRSGYVDRPNKKLLRCYEAIRTGFNEAMRFVKPGVMASDIFTAGVEAAKEAGYLNYGHQLIGHSIGYENHEPPLIATQESFPGVTDYPLEEGMVLCLELPMYEVGFAGVQLENTFLVTNDGYEYLTTMGWDLFGV